MGEQVIAYENVRTYCRTFDRQFGSLLGFDNDVVVGRRALARAVGR